MVRANIMIGEIEVVLNDVLVESRGSSLDRAEGVLHKLCVGNSVCIEIAKQQQRSECFNKTEELVTIENHGRISQLQQQQQHRTLVHLFLKNPTGAIAQAIVNGILLYSQQQAHAWLLGVLSISQTHCKQALAPFATHPIAVNFMRKHVPTLSRSPEQVAELISKLTPPQALVTTYHLLTSKALKVQYVSCLISGWCSMDCAQVWAEKLESTEPKYAYKEKVNFSFGIVLSREQRTALRVEIDQDCEFVLFVQPNEQDLLLVNERYQLQSVLHRTEEALWREGLILNSAQAFVARMNELEGLLNELRCFKGAGRKAAHVDDAISVELEYLLIKLFVS